MSSLNKYQEITKELYSKNLDLLNANKIFGLIQKLYEIMVVSYSVESLSQKFIDIIRETLGFSDGVVVIKKDKEKYLGLAGVTQTQINKTVLELANITTTDIKFDLNNVSNFLVKIFVSGKNDVSNNISDIWCPYIKKDDLIGINSVIGSQTILVYPITFGDKILGSFALFQDERAKDLTEFEKTALDRLITVFGIAIDRVKINIELSESEKREINKTKELLKLKDEFVFIATHDLRTPVTAISGFVDLIQKDKALLPPQMQESFVAIEESSERLNQLINDLLQVARSDSGTVVVDLQSVDIIDLFENVVQELTPVANETNIKINLNLDKNYRFVLADKEKLTEVVENLLSNAIKYNKRDGRVEINSNINIDNLIISIADTGLGIPKEKQKTAFRKFFRARQKGTEAIGGTGLGLFVSRMLLEKMRGKIWLEKSEVDKGTTFAFCLPLVVKKL